MLIKPARVQCVANKREIIIMQAHDYYCHGEQPRAHVASADTHNGNLPSCESSLLSVFWSGRKRACDSTLLHP